MRWLVVLVLAGCPEHGSMGMMGIDATLPDAPFESGRACTSGVAADTPTLVASPALECPTELCLHVQNLAPDECTAECVFASDCVAGTASSCTTGFTCQPVIATGPFACRSVCVCSDRTVALPAGCATGG